jgi:chromosome segregation ATPase
VSDLERQLRDAKQNQADAQTLADLKKEVATLKTARDAAQARVAELEKQLNAVANEKAQIESKLIDVGATKTAEMEQLKSELSSLQTELSQALANAKNQKEGEIARLSAEFESRYTAMQQKHQREIDELARQALADVSGAETRADAAESELVRLRAETKDVSVYKSQIETSEKQLIVVREKLGATEKKLADFLALYGEERKVLEESRKIADELDRIKRRYATSMDIDESTIDEISSKVTESLEKADDGEKMQAMMDGRAKGDTVVDVNDIPVWAYYALGVATAILPRIIAGGGL